MYVYIITSMTAVDAVVRAREGYLMVTMDLNAGYCWPHCSCCFSMIRTEGPKALMVMR